MFSLYVHSDSLVATAWSTGLKSPPSGLGAQREGVLESVSPVHGGCRSGEEATLVPCVSHPYAMLHSWVIC